MTISEDRRAGYATVNYNVQPVEASDETRHALEAIISDGSNNSLLVAVSSPVIAEVPGGLNPAELISVGVAFVVMIFTLGTLLAAGMSLLTALIGVGVGVLAIATATGFIDMGSTTPLLATMLALAVGIDYALFIFSRYRHELQIGRTPEDAAGRAVGTAGTAVVFAGLAVVIALCGLSLVQIRFLTEMGIAAAFAVVVAVLIAVTLLPAVFGFVKARVMTSRIRFLARVPDAEASRPSFGRRWAMAVTKHRWKTFVIGTLGAIVLAIPMFSMQLAVPDDATAERGSQARTAYDLMASNFGEGANGPLLVVVDTANVQDKAQAIRRVDDAVLSVKDEVASIVPASPTGLTPEATAAFEEQLSAVNFATTTVLPTTGPSDERTNELVAQMRDLLKPVAAETGSTIYVSGQTAVGIDIADMLFDAFPRYLLVVIGLAFVLMVIVFRSILVPVKAVVGFLLSIGVALGVTVAITQWGWGAGLVGIDDPAPLMFLLPLLLTGILFGLAMDYEVFLVSRMREEYVHGKSAQQAIVSGFAHSARVVTAAALIMISVFGGFALTPEAIIKVVGLGLAVGLLTDAFLVRMTLVPAFMAICGDRMWWMPKWLDRIVPQLDLEGEQLTKRLASSDRR